MADPDALATQPCLIPPAGNGAEPEADAPAARPCTLERGIAIVGAALKAADVIADTLHRMATNARAAATLPDADGRHLIALFQEDLRHRIDDIVSQASFEHHSLVDNPPSRLRIALHDHQGGGQATLTVTGSPMTADGLGLPPVDAATWKGPDCATAIGTTLAAVDAALERLAGRQRALSAVLAQLQVNRRDYLVTPR